MRTAPLKALVIGAFVRSLSMRDVESLCEQAGLGKLAMTTASRMCDELKERFEALLSDSRLLAAHAREAEIDVRLDEFPDQQHSFQMAAGLAPEADDAVDRLAAWARARLGVAVPEAQPAG